MGKGERVGGKEEAAEGQRGKHDEQKEAGAGAGRKRRDRIL